MALKMWSCMMNKRKTKHIGWSTVSTIVTYARTSTMRWSMLWGRLRVKSAEKVSSRSSKKTKQRSNLTSMMKKRKQMNSIELSSMRGDRGWFRTLKEQGRYHWWHRETWTGLIFMTGQLKTCMDSQIYRESMKWDNIIYNTRKRKRESSKLGSSNRPGDSRKINNEAIHSTIPLE